MQFKLTSFLKPIQRHDKVHTTLYYTILLHQGKLIMARNCWPKIDNGLQRDANNSPNR